MQTHRAGYKPPARLDIGAFEDEDVRNQNSGGFEPHSLSRASGGELSGPHLMREMLWNGINTDNNNAAHSPGEENYTTYGERFQNLESHDWMERTESMQPQTGDDDNDDSPLPPQLQTPQTNCQPLARHDVVTFTEDEESQSMSLSAIEPPSLTRASGGEVPGAHRVRGVRWHGVNNDDDGSHLPNEENYTPYRPRAPNSALPDQIEEEDEEEEEIRQTQMDGDSNQANVPFETLTMPDTNSQHAPSASNYVLDDNFLLRADFFRDLEKKSKQRIWCIIITIIIILGVSMGIGLVIGLSGKNTGVDQTKTPKFVEKCQHENVASIFMAWKKCLCDGGLAGISEKEIDKYNSVRDELSTYKNLIDLCYNISSCEASNLALHWLAEDSLKRNDSVNDTLLDRFVLAKFFLSLTKYYPDRWTNKAGWLTNNTVCSWKGIICSNDQNITKILLNDNDLVGDIPTEMSLLTELSHLALSKNSISGTIPTEIGRMTGLSYLDLSRNNIRGTIPTEIGVLKKIENIFLQKNDITGNLPSEVCNLSLLKELQLSENLIVGTIPKEIGKMTSLEGLIIEGRKGLNVMKGIIPSTIGLCTNLQRVEIPKNEFSGSIPSEIGMLSDLEHLFLFKNDINGSIPSTLGSCTLLSKLDLSQNAINGKIFSEIGLLTNLVDFIANSNEITGPIPSTIGKLHNMTRLNLNKNEMFGPIPTTLASCTSLQHLILSLNHFKGNIPSEIGSLGRLEILNLGLNKISGRIPSHLGKCQNLKTLILSGNVRISGTLSSELGSLSNLKHLNFMDTGLTGTIPSEICCMQKLANLDLKTNFEADCV